MGSPWRLDVASRYRYNLGPIELGVSVFDGTSREPLLLPRTATNAAESLISRTRHVTRHVTRWRGGQMMLRWVAAGVLEAAKGFRRLKGHADMPQLVAALRARDQRLGLGDATEVEQVAWNLTRAAAEFHQRPGHFRPWESTSYPLT